ncbi:hypothetical protein BD779DRAFT_1447625 [Infundibulicybe gibba]|nr:hypothetical protein BD779DRAFT_1447625 [Infundibulicybe gibba]
MAQEGRTGTLRDGYWIKRVPSAYTPAQVAEYLQCVGLTQYTESNIASGGFPPSFDNLGVLIRFHLLTFPFEHTAMHYTPDHTMDVTAEGAFRRFVHECKGSYCFGHNNLFLQILRGLGYRAYAGSARVNMAPGFSSPPNFSYFSHMFVFVQPFENNQTYIVDVGFGATGLTRPILLSDAEDNVVFGTTPTERHRLRLGPHPLSSLGVAENPSKSISSALSWQLEAWHDKQDPAAPNAWKILFTFPEDEFLDVDVQNASYITAMKPGAIPLFWSNVVCMKHLLIRDMAQVPEEDVYTHSNIHDDGTFMYRLVMVENRVTEHVGTRTTSIRTLESERDRIVAMRELFKIPIEDSAIVYMEGRAPSLG